MVVVCLAPADLRPEVDPLTGTVRSDPRRADLSPAEEAALEHGLRAADAWGGWVLAVAAGPAEIEPVLAAAAAVGAHPVRLPWGSSHDVPDSVAGPREVHASELAADPSDLAAALATAIRAHGEPKLVVCGDRSAHRGIGAVPALLAHHLGLAQALGLVGLSVGTEPGTITAERRLDAGWRERLRLSDPAVVSVEAAGVRLRRAGLAAALAAGEVAAVPVFAPGAGFGGPGVGGGPVLGGGPVVGRARVRIGAARPYRPRTKPVPPPEGDTRARLIELTGALSSREPPRIVGPVEPSRAADELIEYLHRHGYL